MHGNSASMALVAYIRISRVRLNGTCPLNMIILIVKGCVKLQPESHYSVRSIEKNRVFQEKDIKVLDIMCTCKHVCIYMYIYIYIYIYVYKIIYIHTYI